MIHLIYDKADLTLGIEHLNVKTWMNEENSLLVMDIYDIEGKKDMSKMKELYFLQQEITLDEKSAIKIKLKK